MEIILLIICLIIVLSFEFINGMNDTANAIAPVIYSHSLEPKKSVLIAAILNFLGVMFGGIAVAMSIVHLLPLGIIVNQTTTFGIILIVSILISAIIWDLGAWYLALPVSSSHALIGSILGVSIAVMYSSAGVGYVPHWGKEQEVIIGLLISPIIGFTLALVFIYAAHRFTKRKRYFRVAQHSGDHPTLPMRILLIVSSGLVSFMHGKNDGQKGVGIATLILVTLIPGSFAINPNIDKEVFRENLSKLSTQLEQINITSLEQKDSILMNEIQGSIKELDMLFQKENLDKLSIRKQVLYITDTYGNLGIVNSPKIITEVNAGNSTMIALQDIKKNIDTLSTSTDYVPWWIIVLVSIAIGSGTLIGWKRIVKTIGEKIGKYKMNYSQAASSALVTAGTIGLASTFGLPVSTTHVMSSSVAGTMVEEHGWKDGVDPHMIKHILLAWVLTMPVTLILAGGIFILLKFIFGI